MRTEFYECPSTQPESKSLKSAREANEMITRGEGDKCTLAHCLNASRSQRTPPAALGWLAKTGILDVVLNVACNKSASPMTLYVLSQNVSDDIKLGVAENPRTPQIALEILEKDTCSNVARAAKKQIDLWNK